MIRLFCLGEYGHRDVTRKAVDSIFHDSHCNIVFVGNDAHPDPVQTIPDIATFNYKVNVGYCRNMNRLIRDAFTTLRSSREEMILFVCDNDIVFFPGSIPILSQYAMENKAIAAPSLLVPDGMGLINRQIQHADTLESRSRDKFNPTMVSGCCMAMRVSIWLELGGYDEDFYHQYSDDDFCIRAAAQGIEITCLPEAVISHEWGRTINEKHPSLQMDVNKGRETFNWKHPERTWDPNGEY